MASSTNTDKALSFSMNEKLQTVALEIRAETARMAQTSEKATEVAKVLLEDQFERRGGVEASQEEERDGLVDAQFAQVQRLGAYLDWREDNLKGLKKKWAETEKKLDDVKQKKVASSNRNVIAQTQVCGHQAQMGRLI